MIKRGAFIIYLENLMDILIYKNTYLKKLKENKSKTINARRITKTVLESASNS